MRSGRLAVVTGGSSGIGAATARALTQRGWRCVLLARGRERLETVAAELGAEAEPCDVGDREEVEAAAARIAGRHDAVGLLVANAGVRGRLPFTQAPPELVEEVIRTNYLGAVWTLRAFLPLLRAGAPSHVVNVVSVAGTVAHGASGPYVAAKHAQFAFSRATAAELAPSGIRVHAVAPGPVETPGFPQGQLRGRPLLGRLVRSPDDVAEAILRAVERNRAEVYVPAWLRIAGPLQSLAPALLGRVVTRVRERL